MLVAWGCKVLGRKLDTLMLCSLRLCYGEPQGDGNPFPVLILHPDPPNHTLFNGPPNVHYRSEY